MSAGTTLVLAFGALVLISIEPSALAGDLTDIQVVPGICTPQSNIAEGPTGSDLTKRQSRYFCDTAVIGFYDKAKRHILLQFAQKSAHHGPPVIGYAGDVDDDGEMVHIRRIYFEPLHPTNVDGICQFKFKKKHLDYIICGGRADEGGRSTAAVVAFQANPNQ